MYLSMEYFLYYCKMDFFNSTMFCLPIAVMTEIICSIVILQRITFKK